MIYFNVCFLFPGTIYNAISGKIPSPMMVFFLTNSPLSGDISSNPFHFGRHELTEACLLMNGQTFPSEKIVFEESSGNYFEAYQYFMKNIGCTGDVSVGIPPNRYIKDCFALAFDLTPGKE